MQNKIVLKGTKNGTGKNFFLLFLLLYFFSFFFTFLCGFWRLQAGIKKLFFVFFHCTIQSLKTGFSSHPTNHHSHTRITIFIFLFSTISYECCCTITFSHLKIILLIAWGHLEPSCVWVPLGIRSIFSESLPLKLGLYLVLLLLSLCAINLLCSILIWSL